MNHVINQTYRHRLFSESVPHMFVESRVDVHLPVHVDRVCPEIIEEGTLSDRPLNRLRLVEWRAGWAALAVGGSATTAPRSGRTLKHKRVTNQSHLRYCFGQLLIEIYQFYNEITKYY
jgi:hypothetical protein